MPSLEYFRPAPNPVALVLFDWIENGKIIGTEIAHQDESGDLYGCRTVAANNLHDACIAAWISDAVGRKAMALIDNRTTSAKIYPNDDRSGRVVELLRYIQNEALAQHGTSVAVMKSRLNAIADKASAALREFN